MGDTKKLICEKLKLHKMICSTKKRRKPIRFTKEEDEIILYEISLSPTNLLHAFDEAANRLVRRDARGVGYRWYSVLKKRSTKITCGSSQGLSVNVKNNKRKDGNPPKQELKSFIVVLSAILIMKDEEIKLLKKVLAKY